MTTEDKALALWNAVRAEREYTYEHTSINRHSDMAEALCRAIEQHEAFRQEVSNAVEQADLLDIYGKAGAYLILQRFIITAPKPDLLVEIISEIEDGTYGETKAEYVAKLRDALDARGLEIREKTND